jgi:probable HAF family extracellular repeat protein
MASHSLKKGWIWGMLIAIGMVIAIVGSTALSSLSAATTTTKFSYTVEDLGTLGGKNSYAHSINNAGKAVGYSETSSGDRHAVLWEKGKKIDLGTLGGVYSNANAINNAGKVVGYSGTSSGASHAVLWVKGKKIDLGTLGNDHSVALSINNAGKVVGYSKTSSDNNHAVLWNNNSIKDLNNLIPPQSGWVLNFARDINDKGQIVGSGKINGQTHAFLLTPVK